MISLGGGGGGSAEFNFKSIIMAMVILFALPILISVFAPSAPGEFGEEIEELNQEYRSFTGSGPAKEAVWCLTGIYTPYDGRAFGYTSDGWLYGERITEYSPSQLQDSRWQSTQSYTVERDASGIYRYTIPPAGQHIEAGDTYTSVMMDAGKISTVFFTEAGKKTLDQGFFYYDYTGYRYAFAPLRNYTGVDQDGNPLDIVAKNSSLSVIWYQYAAATLSGIAGQLVIGHDAGLSYITSDQIIAAFSETTSTAKFSMAFNGLDMNIYIRINPYAIDQGLSIADCYNLGLWSIMVTSISTDIDAYTSADGAFSIYQIWDTIVSLFTFNLDKYFDLSGWLAVLLPFIFMAIMYGTLLTIGLDHQWVLILAGILAVLQGIAIVLGFTGGGG